MFICLLPGRYSLASVIFPVIGPDYGTTHRHAAEIYLQQDKTWLPAKRSKRWLLRYFPHKGGFLVCGDGHALTEAGQPVGAEVKGRGFVVVQRGNEFSGERGLGQAEVLVAEGED